MPDQPLTGRCLCGERALPRRRRRPTGAGYCHCTRCQRRTGTLVLGAGVDRRRRLRAARRAPIWSRPGATPTVASRRRSAASAASHLFSRDPDDHSQMSIRMSAFDADPGVRPSLRALRRLRGGAGSRSPTTGSSATRRSPSASGTCRSRSAPISGSASSTTITAAATVSTVDAVLDHHLDRHRREHADEDQPADQQRRAQVGVHSGRPPAASAATRAGRAGQQPDRHQRPAASPPASPASGGWPTSGIACSASQTAARISAGISTKVTKNGISTQQRIRARG